MAKIKNPYDPNLTGHSSTVIPWGDGSYATHRALELKELYQSCEQEGDLDRFNRILNRGDNAFFWQKAQEFDAQKQQYLEERAEWRKHPHG